MVGPFSRIIFFAKNYLDKFVKEYKMLCPKNGSNFNKRRDRESCPTAWAVANSVGVKGWKEKYVL